MTAVRNSLVTYITKSELAASTFMWLFERNHGCTSIGWAGESSYDEHAKIEATTWVHCMLRARATMIVSALLLTSAGVAPAAQFMGLGDLPGGGFWSRAHDVSIDGSVVVGNSDSGSQFNSEAFRWTAETGMVGLGHLPGKDDFSRANAVSADGSVVVGESRIGTIREGQWEGFRWTVDGGMVGLGDLPGRFYYSPAHGASHDGSVVVGISSSGTVSTGPPEVYRWTEAVGMVGLGFGGEVTAVSDDGTAVIGSTIGETWEAFRWTADDGKVDLGDLPGGDFYSRASDVSADGSVLVGTSLIGGGSAEAFRWTPDGGMVGLGFSPGDDNWSAAWAASLDGSRVVGASGVLSELRLSAEVCLFGASECGEAFIWDETHGMRNLQELLINEFDLADSLAGWTLYWAKGISADGLTIVGDGRNPSGKHEAWLAYLGDSPIQVGDFDSNGQLDIVDIDTLVNEIASGDGNQRFDLSGDGIVNGTDIKEWLSTAALENGFAAPYLLGDANLDGSVDSVDLNNLARNWRKEVALWSSGDFSADGIVDPADLNAVALNWQQSIRSAAFVENVPEPAATISLLIGIMTSPFLRYSRHAESPDRNSCSEGVFDPNKSNKH